MKVASLAAAIALAASSAAATAMPVQYTPAPLALGPSDVVAVGWHNRYPPEGSLSIQQGAGYVNDNGGYKVNRYGYGNYFGGPGGGFAGYPAGSGEAFVYQQQHQWKCHYVPERC